MSKRDFRTLLTWVATVHLSGANDEPIPGIREIVKVAAKGQVLIDSPLRIEKHEDLLQRLSIFSEL